MKESNFFKNKIKNYHYANLHYQTSRVDATRNHTAPSVFANVDFVNVTLYLFCGTLWPDHHLGPNEKRISRMIFYQEIRISLANYHLYFSCLPHGLSYHDYPVEN